MKKFILSGIMLCLFSSPAAAFCCKGTPEECCALKGKIYCPSEGDVCRTRCITAYPSDVTVIEYIESTGSQYLNTGYIPTENTKIEADISTSTVATGCIAGARGGFVINTISMFYINTNRFRFDYGNQQINGPDFGLNVRNILAVDKNGYYIDGVLTAHNLTGTSSGNYPIYVLAVNTSNGATTYPSVRQLYRFSIYEGNKLVRNMLPVLDGNNVPCMWDSITGQFYYNAGSDIFNYE